MMETPTLKDFLSNWLTQIGLAAIYEQKFRETGYDNILVCSNLEDKDLDAIGITLPGHRKTLLLHSQQLSSRDNKKETQFSPRESRDEKRSSTHNFNTKLYDADEFLRRAQAIVKEPYQGTKDYKPKFRILLVRHGLSEANVDKNLYKTMSDHAIPVYSNFLHHLTVKLAPQGRDQAKIAGQKVIEYFKSVNGGEIPPGFRCRLWTSCYKRARETADIIYNEAKGCITDMRESIFLGEQQFGLFEGSDWTNGELDEEHPKEIVYYRKASQFGGRFWAKVPLGESRFDVCMRVCRAFGSFQRDAIRHNITNLVVVSHGITIRAFLMMWLHKFPEWFEVEPNPQNCSIRVIEGEEDKEYLWGGPEKPKDLLLSNTTVEVIV